MTDPGRRSVARGMEWQAAVQKQLEELMVRAPLMRKAPPLLQRPTKVPLTCVLKYARWAHSPATADEDEIDEVQQVKQFEAVVEKLKESRAVWAAGRDGGTPAVELASGARRRAGSRAGTSTPPIDAGGVRVSVEWRVEYQAEIYASTCDMMTKETLVHDGRAAEDV